MFTPSPALQMELGPKGAREADARLERMKAEALDRARRSKQMDVKEAMIDQVHLRVGREAQGCKTRNVGYRFWARSGQRALASEPAPAGTRFTTCPHAAQIVDEIKERREFLEAMQRAGKNGQYEYQVGCTGAHRGGAGGGQVQKGVAATTLRSPGPPPISMPATDPTKSFPPPGADRDDGAATRAGALGHGRVARSTEAGEGTAARPPPTRAVHHLSYAQVHGEQGC